MEHIHQKAIDCLNKEILRYQIIAEDNKHYSEGSAYNSMANSLKFAVKTLEKDT